MLNELLAVERGAMQAGVEIAQLHPDVKECGRIPTLLVRLLPGGQVATVRPMPPEARSWTLRDGQQNSFPFVQPKLPLLKVPAGDERRERAVKRRSEGRRDAVLGLCKEMGVNPDAFDKWPTAKFISRQQERRTQLAALKEMDARIVLATIEDFIAACDQTGNTGSQYLLESVVRQLVTGVEQNAEEDWLNVAIAILVGKFNTKKRQWECAGGLLFEADGFPLRIFDLKVALQLSRVLSEKATAATNRTESSVCRLTGLETPLLSGNFPQPNLPVLGQTFIFAKNKEIPAAHRYDRFAAEAMPVGQSTVERLAASLKALTAEQRRGKTWTDVPSDAAKQKDLFLAFVEAVPDAPAVGTLVDDDEEDEEDYSEEVPEATALVSESVATFEKRTERLIEAVRGKTSDFQKTPVHLAVFRKVDPANRKVVYAGAPTVGELHDAAAGWAEGERNVPPWLTMPILRKGERMPRLMAPPHVAPLGVISFSRQMFVRQGSKRQEVPGMPAAEALGLFLESSDAPGTPGQRRVTHALRLVLTRRAALVSGAAHAQRCKGNRKNDFLNGFDGREVLRTITVLALLLHKLGRSKEAYMSDMAFKLGQLLAAADMVHAGYCADVRGGSLPPSLLGNQVFAMAQAAPAKALATLCRRWKPYDGWAKKAARERNRAEQLVGNKNADEQQRGWDIRRALRHAREIGRLANELGPALADCRVNDTFRAELLLGYMAGLPKAQRDDTGDNTQTAEDRGQEG